jgi:3-isopropylmalate dehydrogenase
MSTHPLRIGILDGDDIGLEIVPASVQISRAAAGLHGVAIDWKPLPIGARALETHGHTLPPETLDTLKTLDGWILGPIGHRAYPKVPNAINPHPILRKSFNLFANVRPTRSYPDIGCLHENVDLVIVRENNEGFQPDRNMVAGSGEFRPTDEVTLSVRVITRTGSRRVAKAAFELARQRRKHLTYVHKDTVFKLGCGMFVEECKKLAAEYPDVRVDDVIVDTFAMRLVRDPQNFDVVVTTNMFGDILSDLTAELSGSLGLGGSLNAGADHAMGQAAHGSAPDIAGRNIANPLSLILSAGMLLGWHGQRKGLSNFMDASAAIERAAAEAVSAQETTRDVGGSLGTREAGAAFARRIASDAAPR